MHLDDIRDIVSRASINEDGEIDSDAFEQICVHFAKEWAIGNINSPYTISFRANKPIDITITEHARGARMENWKKIAGEAFGRDIRFAGSTMRATLKAQLLRHIARHWRVTVMRNRCEHPLHECLEILRSNAQRVTARRPAGRQNSRFD